MDRDCELVFAEQLQHELRRVVREQHDELFVRLDVWLAARLAQLPEAANGCQPPPLETEEDTPEASHDEDETSADAANGMGKDVYHKVPTQTHADTMTASRNSMDFFKPNHKSSDVASKSAGSTGFRLSNTMDLSKYEQPSFRTKVKGVVNTYAFELCFSIIIVVNSIFIGAEVQYRAVAATMEPLLLFAVVQNVCVALFIVELVLRVFAEGGMFFKSEKWAWNIFDLILVVVGLFDIGLDLATAAARSNQNTSFNLTNVRLIRIARIARLARLLRVARLVRFVRALSILLYSIASTFKSLIWATLLMVVVMYFFGILFTQAAVESLHFCRVVPGGPNEDCVGMTLEQKEELATYWGDLPSAMFTLFKSVTGGIDWQDVVRPLEAISGVWVFLFIFYTGFADFALLNVVTGVFCQSAIESAQHDRELMSKELLQNKALYVNKIKDQFQDMFAVLDSGKSGQVTIDSFTKHLKDPTVQAYFALLDLDAADAWSLFQLLDAEGTNLVDAEEFVDGCLRLKGTARSIDLAKLRQENKRISQRINEVEVLISEAVSTQPKGSRAPGRVKAALRMTPAANDICRHGFRDAATAASSAMRKENGAPTQIGRPSTDIGEARLAESPANSTSLGMSSANTQEFGGLVASGAASGGNRSPPQLGADPRQQADVRAAHPGTDASQPSVRFLNQMAI